MKLAAVSNLAQRVLVGVVFGPLLVALFWTGGLALLATLWVVTAVGTWEYCKMQEKKGLQPWTWLGVAASLIWCVWNFHFNGSWVGVPLAGSLLLLLALGMCSRENGFRMADAGATLIGSLYVGFLASFALLVRNFSGFEGSQDGAFTVLVLVGIWATDIGAYVAGRLFGRRHPFPRISPGKTEAGFIGGVIGALAVMLAGGQALDLFPLNHGLGLGLVVGLGAPLGDLAESAMKRDAGVKDASNLLPGHGGMLDRFDSFLFVYPIVYVYLVVWTFFEGVR